MVHVLVKPWPFVVSDIYHTSEASVINVMTPQKGHGLTDLANVIQFPFLSGSH